MVTLRIRSRVNGNLQSNWMLFCESICNIAVQCKLNNWGTNIHIFVFTHHQNNQFQKKQDACTGVHSACQREENGHNLDICALRRLRLRQGQMQGFLGLKVGGGLNLQIWDLNRAHETERSVFPILQVFSMCRCKL